jgi:hypothetical protein
MGDQLSRSVVPALTRHLFWEKSVDGSEGDLTSISGPIGPFDR